MNYLESKEFPEKLLKVRPKISKIFYEGNINLIKNKSIAIVGSRDFTEYGKKQAKIFSEFLSNQGITIISGLAIGIDTIAHLNSYNNHGKSIAVIPSGLSKIYPPENEELCNVILKNGGLVITEYEKTDEINMNKIPLRNRIISGLSDGILIIEAKERSGSTITARYGFLQHKNVFCIPGEIGKKNSSGVNLLIKEGATLVTNPKEIVDYFDMCESTLNEKNKKYIDKEFIEVLEFIGNIPVSINEIVRKTKKTVSEINEQLLFLEMNGQIKSLPGGMYIINS